MSARYDRTDEALADFELGEWCVQPSLNRCSRGAETVRIEPKLMDVLLLLRSRAGKVVHKDDIAAAVWPEVFVSESVITRAIAGLRRAFGDDARAPRYIETIAKRGYRLLMEATTSDAASNRVRMVSPETPAEPPMAVRPGIDAGPTHPSPSPNVVAPASTGQFRSGTHEPPYLVGQWVRGERFYGRDALIREILTGPRNGIWILGSRAIGKTSLLKRLEELASHDPAGPFFPLFWDLQGSDEPEDVHEDFSAALAESEPRLDGLGLTATELQSDDIFRSLGRLRRALKARGKTLLLLWDEVEELVGLHAKWPALLRKLRRALQSQEGIRTVMASGPRLWHLAEQRDETSPFLHGFAPPLYLGPLAQEAACSLVSRGRSSAAPSTLGDEEIRELQLRSGNHPSLLQLLCMRYLESGDLDAATEAVSADLTVRYFLSVDFDLLDPLEQEVLLLLAEGKRSLADLDTEVSAARPELASRLLHLERMGQVRRAVEGSSDGVLEIGSPILGRWLRQR